MTSRAIYNTARWKRLRREVLDAYPVCHWCGKAPSTEADHLQPLAEGGDPYNRDNLVGACRPCNARRGQRVSERSKKAAFGPGAHLPRRPLDGHSRQGPADVAEPADIQPGTYEPGRIGPRLLTPAWGGMTIGGDVARWAAKHLGVDLYPWQVQALNGMLETDSDEQLRHRWALCSTARQNGKTRGLLAPLVGYWLTEGRVWRGDDAQQVISVAHKISVAEDVARALFPVLEESFGYKTYVSAGRMEAHHDGGSRWRIEAANARAGHGTTNDLVIADEIWKIESQVIETGLLPTQRARPNPFALFVSTAGTEQSQFFMRWRERGIAAIESGEPGRLYMAEWSPPSNAMADDRQYWHLGNPALGLGGLTMQDLEDEYAQPDRDNFMRSSLNLWTSAVGSWLAPGTWEKLVTDEPMPAGGWLAIDSDQTDLRYCGVRVVARPDGVLQTRAEFVVESVTDLWREVARVMADKSVHLLATPGLAAIVPVDLARRMTMFGQREVTQYTGLVRSLILEGKVRHAGQTSMTEHVNRAVAGRAGPAITLTSAKSPGPIEMARCMVAAAGLAARPTSQVRKPMIGIAH